MRRFYWDSRSPAVPEEANRADAPHAASGAPELDDEQLLPGWAPSTPFAAPSGVKDELSVCVPVSPRWPRVSPEITGSRSVSQAFARATGASRSREACVSSLGGVSSCRGRGYPSFLRRRAAPRGFRPGPFTRRPALRRSPGGAQRLQSEGLRGLLLPVPHGVLLRGILRSPVRVEFDRKRRSTSPPGPARALPQTRSPSPEPRLS
jgi:hypothetical protein